MSQPINSSGDKPPAYSPPNGQAYGEPQSSQPYGQPQSTQPYGQSQSTQPYGPQPVSYPAGTPYQGYQAGAPPGYQQATGAPQPGGYVPAQPIRVSTTNVVLVGGCPACRIGILEDDFTLLGVCCAVLFFPLGILCCLAMRQRRCQNCGAVFG